jgi:hypothetical protein
MKKKLKIQILAVAFGILVCGSVYASDAPDGSDSAVADPSKVEKGIQEDDYRVREEFLRNKEKQLTEMQAQLTQAIENFEHEKSAWQEEQDKEVASQVDALYESKRQELERERLNLAALKAQIGNNSATPREPSFDQVQNLKELQSKLKAAENQQEGWRKEMKQLADQVKSKSDANRRLEEQISALQTALEKAKSEAKAAVALPIATDDKHKELLSQETAALEAERKIIEADRTLLEADKKKLEAQQQEQESLLAGQRQEIEKQRQALEAERSELRQQKASVSVQPTAGIADLEMEKKNLEAAQKRFDQERAEWDAQKQAQTANPQTMQPVSPPTPEKINEGPSLADRIRDLEKKKEVIRKLVGQKIDELNAEKERLAKDRVAFEKERESVLSGQSQT